MSLNGVGCIISQKLELIAEQDFSDHMRKGYGKEFLHANRKGGDIEVYRDNDVGVCWLSSLILN